MQDIITKEAARILGRKLGKSLPWSYFLHSHVLPLALDLGAGSVRTRAERLAGWAALVAHGRIARQLCDGLVPVRRRCFRPPLELIERLIGVRRRTAVTCPQRNWAVGVVIVGTVPNLGKAIEASRGLLAEPTDSWDPDDRKWTHPDYPEWVLFERPNAKGDVFKFLRAAD